VDQPKQKSTTPRVLPFCFLGLSVCWLLRFIGDGISLVSVSLYVEGYKNESRFGGSYPIFTCSSLAPKQILSIEVAVSPSKTEVCFLRSSN
jgi:hypothetical protein